jgi:hypothetical protein
MRRLPQERNKGAMLQGRSSRLPVLRLTTAAHLRCSGGGERSQRIASSTPIRRVLTRAVRGCGVSGPAAGSSSATPATPTASSSCANACFKSDCSTKTIASASTLRPA